MPPTPFERVTPTWIAPSVVAGLAAFQVHIIEDPDDPQFDPCYDALDAYFGALGQLEPREVMADLVARPREHAGVWTACPMTVFLDADGNLVAAGARFIAFEPASGLLTALDGSGWVPPRVRGAGIAPMLVQILIGAGQRRLAPYGALNVRQVVDLGDLEPFSPEDTDTVRRATFWSRLGYHLLPPEVFPLALVGMADGDTPGLAPPKPMLAMVRLPMLDVQPTHLDKALLHRLADHLAAAHAWAGEDDGTTVALRRSIDAAPDDPVALLPIPTRMPE